MTLYDLITFISLAAVAAFIISHVSISRKARFAAKQHCEQNGLQLLDQNVILKKIGICRSRHQLLAISRHYHFEFSSIGDQRYKGIVYMVGQKIETIELDAYKTQGDFLE